jgi:DNA polymerase I-like protein with 3'-5' exonuclease and polymerase domains
VSIEVPIDLMHDTLLAGHLLFSAEPHTLTSMAIKVLGIDIQPREDMLKSVVSKARNYVRSNESMRDWSISYVGHSQLPSLKGNPNKGKEDAPTFWKVDAWLPRTIARAEGWNENHENGHWHTVLEDYANTDSLVTLPLYDALIEEVKRKGLWEVYLERLKLIKITRDMQDYGLPFNSSRAVTTQKDFLRATKLSAVVCARHSQQRLTATKFPKGISKALKETFFDVLELPVVKTTKKGNPATDSDTVEQWVDLVEPHSPSHKFLTHYRSKKLKDTALGFIDDYLNRGRPIENYHDFMLLHPALNITGAATLRFSCSDPNAQQISKQKDASLRYLFGPLPGREWWSLDYNNIELRIPAYEAEESKMIDLFERPDDPPYYGSYHLLIAHSIHREMFEKCVKDGVRFNDRYKASWYQWTKNGNFAVNYGCGEKKADVTYHKRGAYRQIKSAFGKIAALNQHYIDHANEHGWVPTIPDKRFGVAYPIQTLKNKWGKVKSTIPLNYHVQSTAMWAMSSAMVRCQEYLDVHNRSLDLSQKDGYRMCLQVHDEIVFDFPKRRDNDRIAQDLAKCMEQSGDDIGVPLTVGIDYHPENWGETAEYSFQEINCAK